MELMAVLLTSRPGWPPGPLDMLGQQSGRQFDPDGLRGLQRQAGQLHHGQGGCPRRRSQEPPGTGLGVRAVHGSAGPEGLVVAPGSQQEATAANTAAVGLGACPAGLGRGAGSPLLCSEELRFWAGYRRGPRCGGGPFPSLGHSPASLHAGGVCVQDGKHGPQGPWW